LSDRNKVVKFKKRKNINIGIIVFLIMFLYIAINVYIYFTKDKLSIYEVQEGSTAIDNHITGLILRQEEIIYSQKAGYISYYQKEGARVAKNTPVYSVDDSGQLYSLVTNTDIPVTVSEKNYAEIKHDIRTFQNSFSNDNFSSVYEFKENAKSTVLDILNSTVIDQGQTLLENSGITYSYDMISSDESGIVTYYMDSYEAVTPDTVTEDMFQQESYKRTSLRQTDMLEKDSPIFKLITSETWNLVLPLTELQYDKLNGKEKIFLTVLDDDFEMSAALSLRSQGSSYYAVLTMNKYLSNYLGDRYLDVELDFDTVKGLKIPVSSIVEKDFYKVPKDYLTQGGNSKDMGLTEKVFSKTGEITYPFVPIDNYYKDDSFVYIEADLFPAGTKIQSPVNSEEATLAETIKFTGVYNVNQGYSVFKRIDILYQDDEYCIVDKNTENGLYAYDHIALDGSTAVDKAIIY
jgi:hypothetical protein